MIVTAINLLNVIPLGMYFLYFTSTGIDRREITALYLIPGRIIFANSLNIKKSFVATHSIINNPFVKSIHFITKRVPIII